MSSNNRMFGKAKLFSNLEGMPSGGLTTPKIRVELFEENTPDSAWISELSVLGSLPWQENEERSVEIRILTDEFREYVSKQKPDLNVRRGSQIIGTLVIE